MGYKASYKTVGKKTLIESLPKSTEDLVALPNGAFYSDAPLERFLHRMMPLTPSNCVGCGRRMPDPFRFCPRCEPEYRRAKTWRCGVCSRPVSVCDCSSAYLFRNRIPRAAKLIHYQSGRKDAVENYIIFTLKRKDERVLFRFFAAELEESVRRLIPKSGETVLTFIPRPWVRRAEYGFDQSRRLAEALSERLGIPVVRTLRRALLTRTQKEQETMKERVENAKRSFRYCARESLMGKTVLLVDDLITTGATMVAAASILRSNGAKRICAVAIATSMRHPNIRYEHDKNTHIPWYENR